VPWTNNDFGKGGRGTFVSEAKARAIRVAADIPTETGQVDFSANVIKLKAANADVNFIYATEEESARFLREAQEQDVKALLIGDTTLLSPKVIELAGMTCRDPHFRTVARRKLSTQFTTQLDITAHNVMILTARNKMQKYRKTRHFCTSRHRPEWPS